MTHLRQFTAIIEREDDLSVALCPELDIASQGESITEARDNLAEAIELFFEVASPSEVAIGTLCAIIRQSQLPRSLFEAE